MPVTYVIDAQQKLIRTKCIGNVTLPEVIGHFRELERDPDVFRSITVTYKVI